MIYDGVQLSVRKFQHRQLGDYTDHIGRVWQRPSFSSLTAQSCDGGQDIDALRWNWRKEHLGFVGAAEVRPKAKGMQNRPAEADPSRGIESERLFLGSSIAHEQYDPRALGIGR